MVSRWSRKCQYTILTHTIPQQALLVGSSSSRSSHGSCSSNGGGGSHSSCGSRCHSCGG